MDFKNIIEDKLTVEFTGDLKGNKIKTTVILYLDKPLSILSSEYKEKQREIQSLFHNLGYRYATEEN